MSGRPTGASRAGWGRCWVAALVLWWAFPVAAQEPRGDALQALVHRVAQARRLAPPPDLCVREVPSRTLGQLVRQRIGELYSEADIANEALLLELLGAIDESAFYRQRVMGTVGRAMAGYYDVVDQCLVVADDLEADEHERVLAHELVHALQDHHFDLSRLLHLPAGQSDRRHVAAALVEGDATAVAAAVTRRRHWPELFRRLPTEMRRDLRVIPSSRSPLDGGAGALGVESYLRRLWSVLYARGVEFVGRVHGRSGWPGVDGLLRVPPRSTAELYRSGLPRALPPHPAPIKISWPPRAGGAPGGGDQLGPLGFYLALAPWLGDDAATWAIRSGWAGDQAVLLDRCPRGDWPCVVLLSRWTTHAARVQRALMTQLRRRWPRARVVNRGDSTLFRIDGDRCAVVGRRGSWVLYGVGLSCADALPWTGALLESALSRGH
jgi:hypothetical protein